MVAVEVIDSAARLCEFRPEWMRLAGELGPAIPFQTPQWLLTWWSHFGSGKLHLLVFRDGGKAVGVLPCFLHQWRELRQLTPIGTGISDYLDPLANPRHGGAIVDALGRHLERFAEWEVCDWHAPARAGHCADDTPCSQVALAGSFDLHGTRWRKSGEAGTIEANGAAGFVREAAAALSNLDMVRIFTVYFQERVAAILLALANRTTIFSYLSAFDPEYEAFGFGRELLAQAFEYAHRQGHRYWNFLRGEESYKFSWGAQAVPKCRLKWDRRL